MTMNMRNRFVGLAASALLLLGMTAPRHASVLNESTTYRQAKASVLYVASHVELLIGNVDSAVCLQEKAARLLSGGGQV